MTLFAKKSVIAALAMAVASAAGVAQENVVNVYSGRHYQTDEALYSGFTKATGIKVNRIEASEDAIIERIRNEGARSPADVMITVDAGRLWRAEQAGLFQPVKSKTLEQRIPENLREPGGHWFGFSQRARVIAYNKDKVRPGEITSYEQLADANGKGAFACAPQQTSTTSRSWARLSTISARRKPNGGRKACAKTSPRNRRAATPTS